MRRKAALTLALSVHCTAANVSALSCHKGEESHLSCNSFVLFHRKSAVSSFTSFPLRSTTKQCDKCAMLALVSCNSTSPVIILNRNYCMHTPLLRQSWSKLSTRPWMCVKEECRAINRSIASVCESCGAVKPTLRGWKCVKCDTVNYSGVKKCKKCAASASESNEFWMCAVCKENNRIDEIEDNSRCGYCGYDMAPHRTAEEEILRRAQERQEELQNKQEEFDSITVKEAEDQWGDSLADADRLPKQVREPSKKRIKLPVESIKPFKPAPIPTTSHSRISRQLPSVASAEVNDGPPGFDWMCRVASCKQINPGDEENCMTCKAHITRSEWECQECGALNHASRPRCFACQTTIPVSWNCASCKAETSIYEKQCCECGAARPSVEPRIPSEIKSRANDTSSSRRSHERRSDWNCESCDTLNFAFRDSCFQCGGARSSQKSSPSSSSRDGGLDSSSRHRSGWSSRSDDGWGGGKSSGRAGGFGSRSGSSGNNNNWICAHCESSNFRTRTTCWQCGRDSPSSHDANHTSSKSPVHFDKEGFQDNDDFRPAEGMMNSWNKKEEGWICARCYFLNHANRVDCHKCGTAKVVAVATRRASARKPVKL